MSDLSRDLEADAQAIERENASHAEVMALLHGALAVAAKVGPMALAVAVPGLAQFAPALGDALDRLAGAAQGQRIDKATVKALAADVAAVAEKAGAPAAAVALGTAATAALVDASPLPPEVHL